MRKGIDVSENQGYINWTKVKKAGVEFAILRSVLRDGSPDAQLASNIAGCIKNGIPFDFYKYSYALTPGEATAEVKRVTAVLKDYGVQPSKDTILWMDVEDESQMKLSTKKLTAIVAAFKKAVLAAGFEFGLYMGNYLYETKEIDLTQFNEHTWIARYYDGSTQMPFAKAPDQTFQPTAKTGNLWGWQYTSNGSVDGINGNVDLNIAYYDIKSTSVAPEYYQTPDFTLIDSLNKIGVNSSFDNRKKIAAMNGITNYTGTAKQNIAMLTKLNSGKLVKGN